MTTQQFIETLRSVFYDRLNRKTSWGKEELKLEFERAISDTFGDFVNPRDDEAAWRHTEVKLIKDD